MIIRKESPDDEKAVRKILHPAVEKWFFSKFKEFSLPQLYGILEVNSRNNVLVSAPTGATKTLTAFLSVINELVDSAEKGILEDKVYCVYISPLKSLSYDIEHNLKEPLKEIEEILGKKHLIRVGTRTGDTDAKEKAAMLRKPPHILITTPESLSIMLASKKFREKLSNVEWLIMDEVHAIAENKRGSHLSLAVEFLDRLCSNSIRRVGLSATVAPIDEIARFLVGYHEDGTEKDCRIVDVQFIKDTDLKVASPVDDYIYTDYHTQRTKLYELLDEIIQQHRTTLIFTNTRSATERVIDTLQSMFPSKYSGESVAAHHSSLSKEHRLDVESRLREGRLKCVVSSTSLELGIDIGYIDIVVLLSSPKSVSRALQRCGRSGHQLHSKTVGRLVTLSRDDLVECAILLKDAVEKKIDLLHIPKGPLDVLAQQVFGFSLSEAVKEDELFSIIRRAYPYRQLKREDFISVLKYLSGEEVSLEERSVYGKIFRFDDKTVKSRGKMSRVIYMTNIGTIPDEARVKVKIKDHLVGYIDEGFLERMHRGDIFVLGGKTYEFLYSRGNVAQVRANLDKPATIPSWVSEMLPLSFELANDIGKFRRLLKERIQAKESREKSLKFIRDYLYLDEKSARAIYSYFYEQNAFSIVPSEKEIVVESFFDGERHFSVFHTLFGRRVNDVLSRAVALYLHIKNKKKLDIGISDNGFYIASEHKFVLGKPLESIALQDIRKLMEKAIDNTEVLRRRFRHCAVRSLMILRQYKANVKSVSRQQVSSQSLLAYIKANYPGFPILKEAKREVLEDLMDIESAEKVLSGIRDGKVSVSYAQLPFPSPFAMGLVLEGKTDVFKMEDRMKILKDLHMKVLAEISRKAGRSEDDILTLKDSFSYEKFWKEARKQEESSREDFIDEMKLEFMGMSELIDEPADFKRKIIELMDGYKKFDSKFLKKLENLIYNRPKIFPEKLLGFLKERLGEIM